MCLQWKYCKFYTLKQITPPTLLIGNKVFWWVYSIHSTGMWLCGQKLTDKNNNNNKALTTYTKLEREQLVKLNGMSLKSKYIFVNLFKTF